MSGMFPNGCQPNGTVTTQRPDIKQHHIDATFGGKPVRFRIRREGHTLLAINLRIAEPYALFQKFALGHWTVADLITVLSVAYDDGSPKSIIVTPKAVEDVMNREPPGIYVPLAVAILESYMFGIDPERGTFNEKADPVAA